MEVVEDEPWPWQPTQGGVTQSFTFDLDTSILKRRWLVELSLTEGISLQSFEPSEDFDDDPRFRHKYRVKLLAPHGVRVDGIFTVACYDTTDTTKAVLPKAVPDRVIPFQFKGEREEVFIDVAAKEIGIDLVFDRTMNITLRVQESDAELFLVVGKGETPTQLLRDYPQVQSLVGPKARRFFIGEGGEEVGANQQLGEIQAALEGSFLSVRVEAGVSQVEGAPGGQDR